MEYPEWAPIEIVNLIKLHEERLNSQLDWQTDEKEFLLRDVDMWRRLATRPEMEEIWGNICKDEGANAWWITQVDFLVHTISKIREGYDKGVKLSVKDYQVELKEISDLSSKLSMKLHKFNAASEENNPFLYLHLLANENLDLSRKKSVRQRPVDAPELRALQQRYWPKHYGDLFFPSIEKLLGLLSSAAKIEIERKEFRLELPTKVGAASAFRTYFVRSMGSYLTRSGMQYSPSDIAVFCSVSLDDADITPDLVGALCPLKKIAIHPPLASLTSTELLSVVGQFEEILTMVQNICYPAIPEG